MKVIKLIFGIIVAVSTCCAMNNDGSEFIFFKGASTDQCSFNDDGTQVIVNDGNKARYVYDIDTDTEKFDLQIGKKISKSDDVISPVLNSHEKKSLVDPIDGRQWYTFAPSFWGKNNIMAFAPEDDEHSTKSLTAVIWSPTTGKIKKIITPDQGAYIDTYDQNWIITLRTQEKGNPVYILNNIENNEVIRLEKVVDDTSDKKRILETDPLGWWIDIPFTRKGFRSVIYDRIKFLPIKPFEGDIVNVSFDGQVIIENCQKSDSASSEINFYSYGLQKIKTLIGKKMCTTRFSPCNKRLMIACDQGAGKPVTFELYQLDDLLFTHSEKPFFTHNDSPKAKREYRTDPFSLDLSKIILFSTKGNDTKLVVNSTIDTQETGITLNRFRAGDIQLTDHKEVVQLVDESLRPRYLLSLLSGKKCRVRVHGEAPGDQLAVNVSKSGYYLTESVDDNGVDLKRLPEDFFKS